jgi:hypothetical protein
MSKKIPIFLTALLLLLSPAHRAVADTVENQVLVEFASGEVITFAIEQAPKITYTEQDVTVMYAGDTLTYAMSAIKKLTLGDASASGIEGIVSSRPLGTITCTDGAFHFAGFPQGSLVRLFNLNGQLVQSYTLNGEETNDASISALSAGTYVLTVKGITYKFNKR